MIKTHVYKDDKACAKRKFTFLLHVPLLFLQVNLLRFHLTFGFHQYSHYKLFPLHIFRCLRSSQFHLHISYHEHYCNPMELGHHHYHCSPNLYPCSREMVCMFFVLRNANKVIDYINLHNLIEMQKMSLHSLP